MEAKQGRPKTEESADPQLPKTRGSIAPILPDYLAPDLDVVFIGAAPSLSSEQQKHYYAGPTNKFWRLLHQGGFTPRLLHCEEDSEVLQYRVGLTGLYKNTATSAVHLLPPPTDIQRRDLERKITTHAPRFVCFNGKDVYALAAGRVGVDWGEQEARFGGARVFVVHSSSARADGWGRERLALYCELRRLVQDTRPQSNGE